MANKLNESLDFFGVPLTEGVEIEVPFKHNDRDAVAVFDLSGGKMDRSSSRDFPPEDVDPDVELIGMHYVDDQSEIDSKEIQHLDSLESSAIEKYLDHLGEYTGE